MTPHLFFHFAIIGVWLVLAFYWIIMWNRAKPMAAQHPDPASNLNRILLLVSMVLLGVRSLAIGPLGYDLIPHTLAKALTGLTLTIAGAAYAIWARNTLGDNWSAQPTLKQNHDLIISGPYKLSRHPIYTGIILAVLGTAIMVGQARGFIALGITFIAFWHKSTFEEDLMRQQFGHQYDDYAKRVKRLIPFVF